MRHRLAILLLLGACAADAPPTPETISTGLAAMEDCGITPPEGVEPFTIELPAPPEGHGARGDVIFFARGPADGDADRPAVMTCFRQLAGED